MSIQWTVYSNDGQRKYLTKSEIESFLVTSKSYGGSIHGLCWILAVTGCRISEALSLGVHSIDFEAKQVIILCLKKRQKRVFRAIPLPMELLRSLERWISSGVLLREKFWPISRMTAYRRVCEVMREAGLTGSYASPKGLRHGFAVRAVQSNVPLSLVQRWLGHADIKTTAIYTSAMGPEERELASRLWSGRSEVMKPETVSAPRRRKAIVNHESAVEAADQSLPLTQLAAQPAELRYLTAICSNRLSMTAGRDAIAMPGSQVANVNQIFRIGSVRSC